MLIIGDQELRNNTVAVRSRGEGDQGVMNAELFLEQILDEIKNKKY